MTVLTMPMPVVQASNMMGPVVNPNPKAVSNRVINRRPGREKVAIRVYFEVEGKGSFRAGEHDTSRGSESAWLKPHEVIRLEARPVAGHRFSHWVVDNEYSGSNRSRRVEASIGMTIRAVFVPLSSEDIRC